MTKHLVVIGGGPGGYTAAIRGAQLGANVTLIEKDLVGGTCLNRGCIPTKTLYRTAELLSHFEHASAFAIDSEGTMKVNPEALKNRCDEVSSQLRGGIEQLIKVNAINYLQGSAKLSGPKEVTVQLSDGSTEVLSADAVIIASGSVPAKLPIPGSDLPGVINSDDLLAMNSLPKSMTIVGGGVIGVEFATIYNVFGTEINVVEVAPNLLNTIDSDISKRFTQGLKRKGIGTHVGVMVERIEARPEGLAIIMNGKKGSVEIVSEKVLLAAGRKPYFEGLGLSELGIDHSPKGIVVNEAYETNLSGVYAIGDVIGGIMLAHWAAHQGLTAVEHALGAHPHLEVPAVPGCIFTFPEIATVGLTEDEAKLRYEGQHQCSKFMFGANGKALALGEGEGFVKVVADPDGVVVGMHIMGPHASDLIHEGVIAVSQKLKAADFKPLVHAHPTLSESVYEAILGLDNEAIHMAPKK